MSRTILLVALLTSTSAAAVDVVCLGDSITDGTGLQDVTMPWPAVMGGILGAGFSVINEGISGDGVLELKTRYCAACVAREPDIAVFAIGSNNVGGLPAATIFDHAKEMFNDACQRGFRVIVVDVMPRDFPGASEASRDELNALYLSWVQTGHPASCSAAWVDMSAILDTDGDGAFDAAYRNPSELTHPDQDGMNAIAAAVALVVQP